MTKAHSTARVHARKPRKPQSPDKPHKDFPLFSRANGQLPKKVRGKIHQFGSLRDDPKGEKALKRWLEDKVGFLAHACPAPRMASLLRT